MSKNNIHRCYGNGYFICSDQGYLDDIPINKIGQFEADLNSLFRDKYAALFSEINTKGDYNDKTKVKFIEILTALKENTSW